MMIQDSKGSERATAHTDRLIPSLTNPRRTFEAGALEELGASIKEHGMISAIVARPKPHTRKEHGDLEIVVGERRWRAATLIGLAVVPVDVRALTDAQVEELQHVENAQRADVPPLEEAESIVKLLASRSIEQLATKLGKSRNHVASRAKLFDLIPALKKQLIEGTLELGIALELSKYSPSIQTDAIEEFRIDGTPLHEYADPITIAQVRRWLEEQRTNLAAAPFDVKDATLVVSAGACAACPKRTGNQGDLFGEIHAKDDQCLDRDCFAAKADASYRKKLEQNPSRVVPASDAAKMFRHGFLDHDSGYLELDHVVTYDHKTKTQKTLRDALGDVEVPTMLARNPKGERKGMPAPVIELVQRADLAKILPKVKENWAKKAIKDEVVERTSHGSSRDDQEKWKERQQRTEREHKANKLALERTISAVVYKASKTKPTDEMIRVAVLGAIRMAWSETQKAMCESRGLEVKKKNHAQDGETPLLELAKKSKGGELFAMILEIVMRRDTSTNYGSRGDETVKNIAKAYKVNHAKLLLAAKKEIAEQHREAKARKQKREQSKKTKAGKALNKAVDEAPTKPTAGTCSKCGCTDTTPCMLEGEPCAWANVDQTICSGCV
jgi:ParB/RepB/Spo0J family partition protein